MSFDNWTDQQSAAQDAEQAAYDAQQKAYYDDNDRQLAILRARIWAMMNGQQPTRESNDAWQARQGMLPVAPPAPQAPADDLYYYYKLRNQLPPDSPLHAVYGPLEHGQNMEEVVGDNKLMAVPLAAAIPAYTLGKATGLISGTRSPASLDEIIEAYKGLFRGLKK